MVVTFIYAYNTLPDDLTVNGVTLCDWMDLPEVNRVLNGVFGFYGNYQLDGQYVNYLKKGNFLKLKTENNSWQYFEIYNIKKNLSSIVVTARHIGFMAGKNFIEYSFTGNGNGQQIMTNLQKNLAFNQPFNYISNVSTNHQFTAKQVSPIDAIINSNNGNQNLVGVSSGELDMDNYTLCLANRIGDDKGFRINFGVNLETINEEIDEEAIINSLYLIGGVPENDYDQNKDPITYKYLEVDNVNDNNRRIGKRENSECKTIEDLKKWGQSLFINDRIHEPKITHTVSLVDLANTLEYANLYKQATKLHFGDSVYVHIAQLDIDIKERMVEYTWYPTLEAYKTIVLGNDLSLYTSSVHSQSQILNKKIDERTNNVIDTIRNATSWVTGNTSGHVVFRPEKAPSEILIMDTQDVKTAKAVWRWNLSGLSYSDTGINGPFKIAINAKGQIVADFIKTGTLRAIDIFGVRIKGSTLESESGGFKVEIDYGQVRFVRSSDNKAMLSFRPVFVGNSLKGVNLIKEPNFEFGLSVRDTKNGPCLNVLDVPADATVDNPKLKLYGQVSINGSLSINGQQVVPGQGGGSTPGGGTGTGGYPPEVTSQTDKWAWEVWNYLINNGYSKPAAAGILGNIQEETGHTMNPDTDQIGGPAYGLVQWDGSAYPLVGPATWNGREYVQHLLSAAKISENYRTTLAQAKLINWSMYNGQWIGKVTPTSVEGYKKMNNPASAANAFELNFERPAAAHPVRQTYAQNWYNKFKNLKPGT
ncbi:phage tail-type lysozyme domain-containing protein, partial [Melissococcus plutonius]